MVFTFIAFIIVLNTFYKTANWRIFTIEREKEAGNC